MSILKTITIAAVLVAGGAAANAQTNEGYYRPTPGETAAAGTPQASGTPAATGSRRVVRHARSAHHRATHHRKHG
jgi:hypothetical protein